MAANVTCPNTTIKLGHTNVAALVAAFASNVEVGQGSLTTVFNNATLTIPAGATDTWFDVPLTTPFQYNGIDNLVVEITHVTGCSANASMRTIAAAGSRRAFSSVVDTTAGTSELAGVGAEVTANTAPDATQMLMQFVFAGGDNTAIAADRAGANGNTFAPASTGRTQFLVLASDIKGSGPVTGIQVKPLSALAVALSGSYKVTLSHVPAATTALASATFATNVGTNATVVANGVAVNVPTGTTEWWIPLNGSFSYDGTSNLLIDVEATVTAGGTSVAYQNAGGNRIMAANTVAAATGALFPRTLEPKLRFHGGQAVVLPATAQNGSAQVLGNGVAGQVQSLYRNDLLGTSGTIQSVYVRLAPAATPAAATLANYKLYMGHTAKTTYLLADTYASNMTENATVMSGTLTVPAGLKTGDWVKIPLSSPFAYDSSKNLSILFTTDISPANGNTVSVHGDASQFPSNSVGRNDNSVTSSGTPTWPYDGIIDLKIDLAK
jgi:hypothetical protein